MDPLSTNNQRDSGDGQGSRSYSQKENSTFSQSQAESAFFSQDEDSIFLDSDDDENVLNDPFEDCTPPSPLQKIPGYTLRDEEPMVETVEEEVGLDGEDTEVQNINESRSLDERVRSLQMDAAEMQTRILQNQSQVNEMRADVAEVRNFQTQLLNFESQIWESRNYTTDSVGRLRNMVEQILGWIEARNELDRSRAQIRRERQAMNSSFRPTAPRESGSRLAETPRPRFRRLPEECQPPRTNCPWCHKNLSKRYVSHHRRNHCPQRR